MPTQKTKKPLKKVQTKPSAGKELRVFGTGPELCRRHDESVSHLIRIQRRNGMIAPRIEWERLNAAASV